MRLAVVCVLANILNDHPSKLNSQLEISSIASDSSLLVSYLHVKTGNTWRQWKVSNRVASLRFALIGWNKIPFLIVSISFSIFQSFTPSPKTCLSFRLPTRCNLHWLAFCSNALLMLPYSWSLETKQRVHARLLGRSKLCRNPRL